MSVSDYISTVADSEVEQADREAKLKEFMEQPDVFANELMFIYLSKGTHFRDSRLSRTDFHAGFSEEDAEVLVKIIMKKPAAVIDTVIEYQQSQDAEKHTKPTASAAFTFVSFVIFGVSQLQNRTNQSFRLNSFSMRYSLAPSQYLSGFLPHCLLLNCLHLVWIRQCQGTFIPSSSLPSLLRSSLSGSDYF